MSNQEKLRFFLLEYGLNENEIRIYCLLAGSGPQKAAPIAKNLRLQKMQVYRCLKNMESKGVVQQAFEAPKRFAASSIDNLLNERMQYMRNKLGELEAKKKEIVNGLKNCFPPGNREKTERFAVIRGKQKLIAAIEGLRKRAREDFCALITLQAAVNANLRGDHDRIMKGQVPFKYRLLTQITDEEVPHSDMVLKRLSQSKNVEVRCTNARLNPFPGFGLIDNAEVVLITQSIEDCDFSSLWTNNETIVSLIKNYFEELWQDAVDVRNIWK